MSSNVGLTTPRGSGTSGYVQRNLAHLRPRDDKPYSKDSGSLPSHRARQPDREILDHERKRAIELRVFELRDRLEEEEVDEEEIEMQTEALRRKMTAQMQKGNVATDGRDGRGLKIHEVHQLAEAKIKQDERMRGALGISRDYEEGGHWRKQEERLKASLAQDK